MTYRLSRVVVTFGIQIRSTLGDRMSKRCHSFVLLFTLLGWGAIAHAQDDGQGLSLDLGALLAMDVTVVSATKTAQSLEEAPSIMTVITRHDIERWGYDTLSDALKYIVGFYVVDDHVTPNLAVRGISGGLRSESGIVKLMLNGHPITYRPTSGNWLGAELIPLSTIQQIEIIRGPASALYGADAFLGIINVITRQGQDGVDLALSGNLTGENTGFGLDVSAGSALGEFDIFVGLRLHRQDRSGLALPASSPAPTVPSYSQSFDDAGNLLNQDLASGLLMDSASAFIDVHYPLGDGGHLNLSSYYSFQERGAEFAQWAQLTDGQDSAGRDRGTLLSRAHGVTMLSSQLPAGEDTTLMVDGTLFYGGDTDRGRIEVDNPNYHIEQRSKFLGADIQLGTVWQPSPSFTLVGGAGFSYDEETLPSTKMVLENDSNVFSAGDSLNVTSSETVSLWNPGALAQATWEAIDFLLTLTAGFRYDYHNIYGNQYSGRFGIVSWPMEQLYLKLLYGSAFKAPSPTLLYGIPATVGDIIGNPELAPQFVHTVEGQVIYIPFDGMKWSTNVSYNYLQDQASFGLQGFNLVARNVAELSTLTLESILEAHYRNVTGGFLKYEKVWSERNPGLVGYQADLIGTGNAVYPEQVIRAGVWVEVAKAFSRASVMGSYVGERRSSDTNILENGNLGPYSLEAYLVLDATLSTLPFSFGEEGEVLLKVMARNLLDTRASDPGEAGVDYPIAPRTITLQLNVTY